MPKAIDAIDRNNPLEEQRNKSIPYSKSEDNSEISSDNNWNDIPPAKAIFRSQLWGRKPHSYNFFCRLFHKKFWDYSTRAEKAVKKESLWHKICNK